MNRIKNGKISDQNVGVLLIMPGLAVFVTIILYPFIDAVLMSFTNRSMIYPDYKWVMFENYEKVFKDPLFHQDHGYDCIICFRCNPFALCAGYAMGNCAEPGVPWF